MLQIDFPLPSPSLNQWQRMHFHAKKRLRDRYEMVFRMHANSMTRAKPRQFRHVSIIRHGARELDHDNLVGGCKPILDALERAGLIYSDSPQYLRVDYGQRKASAKRVRTVVTIT